MKNYRIAITTLVFLLFIFYNVERMDWFGVQDLIDMKFYVYIIVALSIILLFWFKSLVKVNVIYGISAWMLVYFAFKLFYEPSKSILVGGIYTYLSITEITFMIIAMLLTHYAARMLNDIETTVENITLIGLNDKVKVFENSSEEMQFEIYRSRRYNTPLSVLVIDTGKLDDDLLVTQTIQELKSQISKHYAVIRLARLLGAMTRRTDLVLVRFENNQVAVVCPGIDKESASKLSEKLATIIKRELNISTKIGFTTYPQDAQTFEGLYSLAEEEAK